MGKKQNQLKARGRIQNNTRIDWFPNEKENPELYKHKKFDYYFNNYGFRSIHEEDYHLDDDNDIWCFGCSFTVGIGVSKEDMWPAIVQRETNRKVKNFGVGGTGPATTHRLLRSWYDAVHTKPKKILVLGFFPGRDEVWYDKGDYYLHQIVQHQYKDLGFSYDPIAIEKKYKLYIDEIKNFTFGVKFVDVEEANKDARREGYWNWGRDGCQEWALSNKYWGHFGDMYHRFVANKFLDML